MVGVCCTLPAGRRRRSLSSTARWRSIPISTASSSISAPRRLYQLGQYDEAVSLLKRRILRNPETDTSRVLLAATLGQMGRIDEAREAWREALIINPAYSLEQRRNVLPYKNPADFERIVEGLRKAGLPER